MTWWEGKEKHSPCIMHYAAHTLLSSILSTHTTWTSGVSLWLPKASAVTHGLEDEPILLTALNDGMVNSFNPVQLSAWWSNVDMQYIVSRRKVIEYCTKYVMKSEPRSQSLKEVFTSIVHGLKDGNTSLKAVHKLLINSVGERDYSAQETCHLLLQLPMFKASRDFIVLSLAGSHAVEERLEEHHHATAFFILDHYMHRPNSAPLDDRTLLEFARQYTMPKTPGSKPTHRSKRVVVISHPYCSPDLAGPKYEKYCHQSLMQHKSFHVVDDLLNEYTTFVLDCCIASFIVRTHFKFIYVIRIIRVLRLFGNGVPYLSFALRLDLFASGKELEHFMEPLERSL